MTMRQRFSSATLPENNGRQRQQGAVDAERTPALGPQVPGERWGEIPEKNFDPDHIVMDEVLKEIVSVLHRFRRRHRRPAKPARGHNEPGKPELDLMTDLHKLKQIFQSRSD
jgi:hypothetical protein